MKWIPIEIQAPHQDWPLLVKGTNGMGFDIYAVLQWYKPRQEGYPGFFSPVCSEENVCENVPGQRQFLDITPTHWCSMSDLNAELSKT
jgi:hypothetical protein